jgi:hypothetical protein
MHARISAEVRRTAAAAEHRYDDYDYDEDEAPAPADDGWIEVSSRAAKKTAAPKSKSKAHTAAPDDYEDDFGSEEYGENR